MRRLASALLLAVLGGSAFAAGPPAADKAPDEPEADAGDLVPVGPPAPVVVMQVPLTRPVLEAEILDVMRDKLVALTAPEGEEAEPEKAKTPEKGH